MSEWNSIQSDHDLTRAASIIRQGGIVAFPTETVYGLAADATNPVAVAKIFQAKRRPSFDPLIVHVPGLNDALSLAAQFPPAARSLAKKFWPGPLTLVLPKRAVIPDIVTAGLPAVGLRVPQNDIALQLLRLTGRPLAAPSANPFGGISPTTAAHVAAGLGDQVDMILDGGPCRIGLESTVVSFVPRVPTLLRPGGCSVEDIEQVIGRLARMTPNDHDSDTAQTAPGMLSRHYAPHTRLSLVDHDKTAVPVAGVRCGLVTEGTRSIGDGFVRCAKLSETGCLLECAAAFFAAMRTLDAADLDMILAHRFPMTGLGIALNDRLERAAHKDVNDGQEYGVR
jgi:L-threonylcarbamoyladenylate synthase